MLRIREEQEFISDLMVAAMAWERDGLVKIGERKEAKVADEPIPNETTETIRHRYQPPAELSTSNI